jgi:hypothetical protein
MSISLIDECHRRAQGARRSAEMASMPSQKTHFLELEQRWLRAAESLRPKIVQETKGPMADPKGTDVPRGRPTKFTPERIEQIRHLVALGMSREEIAGILGVTLGSLQVTCSKLGVSLRRLNPKLNPQLNLPAHEVPDTGGPISSPNKVNSVRFTFEQVDELSQGTQQNETAAPPPDEIDGTNLALTMQFRGLERAVPLRLSNEVISALALEGQLRGMSLGQLVGGIVAGAMADGLAGLLDSEPSAEDAGVASRE